MRRYELVAFDLDGVLVDTISSWVWVHNHYGTNNDKSLKAYERGEFDDWEFMRRDIALWTNVKGEVHIDEIEAILKTVPIMPGAKELVERLKAEGTRTAIVSGGLDILARRVAMEVGIEAYLANGLETDENGTLTGEGILRVELVDKGSPMLRLLAEMGVDPKRCAALGNSYIDIPMFEETTFGIAFDPHDERVERAADVVIKEKDLTLAIPHLV